MVRVGPLALVQMLMLWLLIGQQFPTLSHFLNAYFFFCLLSGGTKLQGISLFACSLQLLLLFGAVYCYLLSVCMQDKGTPSRTKKIDPGHAKNAYRAPAQAVIPPLFLAIPSFLCITRLVDCLAKKTEKGTYFLLTSFAHSSFLLSFQHEQPYLSISVRARTHVDLTKSLQTT